jgi:type II secretory pathway component PulF
MPRFRAKYVGRGGRKSTIVLDTVDMASLARQIETQRRGYIVDIRRIRGRERIVGRIRIPGALLLAALDSLELMLVSGVRVNIALRTLADCAPTSASRAIWTEAVRKVEETGSLGEALKGFPRVFDASMVGVFLAHEAAGRLPDGVRRVRDYVAQMQSIRRESVRGIAYPALLCVAGLAASAVLCLFTLPRFSKMLREIGVTRMNGIAGFFFGLSGLVQSHPLCTVLALLSPFVGAWVICRPVCRPYLDRALVSLPVVRKAVEALSMARICTTYTALATSGVRVVEALEFCARVAGNEVFAGGIGKVVASVRDNEPVGVAFERAGVFAPEVVLAVKSGEGSLQQVFARLADYYSAEAKHRVAVALGMIEPIMLILVLAWVFGIALAVILPVVEVVNEVH